MAYRAMLSRLLWPDFLISGCCSVALPATSGLAIGPIIAAGCGHLGDEKYEQHASKLLVEDQLRFLKAIIELTFPNGIASFVGAMAALLPGAGEGEKVVRVRLKKSPLQSQPSSDADSRQTMQ
jgi:hypothetical protein